MEQREFCPCDNRCKEDKYYDGWCYGGLCEDGAKIKAMMELEFENNIKRLEEERQEYINQLKYALKYFDSGKTYDNNVPYTIASTLIKNELNNNNIKL